MPQMHIGLYQLRCPGFPPKNPHNCNLVVCEFWGKIPVSSVYRVIFPNMGLPKHHLCYVANVHKFPHSRLEEKAQKHTCAGRGGSRHKKSANIYLLISKLPGIADQPC